jgi:hypothetical protein
VPRLASASAARMEGAAPAALSLAKFKALSFVARLMQGDGEDGKPAYTAQTSGAEKYCAARLRPPCVEGRFLALSTE